MATVIKRGKSYRFRCYDGYDQNGNQIERSMTWTPPKGMSEKKAEKLARQEAALFEKRVQTGQIADSHPVKFSEFVDRWFRDYASTQLRPKTVAAYQQLMKRVIPSLGHLRIDRIKPAHLMQFYRELSETHKQMTYLCKGSLRDILRENRYNITSFSAVANVSRSGLTNACQGKAISERNAKLIAKGLKQPLKTLFEESHSGETLSAETISKYHRVLSSIFQTAVEWQVIVSNPCERVKPPKGEKEDAIFLNAEQAIHLLELLENAPIYYATAVTVLLFTGMRRGELLGLEWSDIDLKHQLISISRTSQYLPDRGIFDDQTKNHSSKRVIRIADSTVQSLKRLRAWQNQQRLKLGELWNGSTKVFTTATGKPIHPDTLSGWFHKFILRTDLPPVHLHSLRHTNATLAITNGVAVTTVAGQLGHSSPNTTTKIYAHTIQQAQAEAAEMMDDLLAPKKKRTHSA